MTVSIIIACYNCKAEIDRCLESILGQTYTDYEVLLIDDGSQDGTRDYLQQKWGHLPQVRIFSQPHLGPGPARNVGIREARGDYLTFVDSDDWLETDYLAEMVWAASLHGADFICTGAWQVDTSGKRAAYRSPELSMVGGAEAAALLENFTLLPVMWAAMVRTSLVREQQICFPPTMDEDLLFKYRLLYACRRLCCLAKPLYNHTIGLASTSTQAERYMQSFPKILTYVRAWTSNEQKLSPEQQGHVETFFLKVAFSHLWKLKNECPDVYRKLAAEYLGERGPFGQYSVYIRSFMNLYCQMEADYQQKLSQRLPQCPPVSKR